MLNDLKSISSSIIKKQNKFNPSFDNNFFSRNKNKFFSHDSKKQNNINKFYNYNNKQNDFNNKIRTQNYTNINLLDQIIGVQNDKQDEDRFKSELTITEDNFDINDYYENKFK